MERIDLRGRGIHPAVFDACPAEKLRQDTPLRSAQQPQQGEADPSVQESDRLPEIPETFPEEWQGTGNEDPV